MIRLDKGDAMMRKRVWIYKSVALLLAAVVTVEGGRITAENSERVYAAEKRKPGKLVAGNVDEAAKQSEMEKDEGTEREVTKSDAEESAKTEMTAKEREAERKIDEYFDDSVFVGDSIMLGFRNYAMKRQDTFLSRMQFLAAGSFSANNALWDVNNKESVHPVYRGEPRQVWDSISMMGSKKIFVMLGMNDLNVTGLEGTWEKYEELLGKIEEGDPDGEIHIMSMTYILHGKEVGNLENDTIREYNNMLKEMARENGWGYVNVADALADSNGDLAEEYCSDEFAHQNPAAYDVWVSVLRDYAREQLERTEYAEKGSAKSGNENAAGVRARKEIHTR